MRTLVVATTNPGKIIEFRESFRKDSPWILEPLPPPVPDVEETGSTFLENATLKAVAYSRLTEELTVSDDSGICVDALGGRPGIHSARYAESAHARIDRLLGELRDVPREQRSAQFVCALCVARRGEVVWTVESVVRGLVHDRPAGIYGFGYDPVFFLPEHGRTMAEIPPELKNRVSHRGLAVGRLEEFLESQ